MTTQLNASIALALLVLVGCSTSEPEFSSNRIYLRLQENNAGEDGQVISQQVTDIATAVTALFGTPDEPFFVNDADLAVSEVLDIDNLDAAAGPILKDNYGKGKGLYRQHCVHCHGITGDGMGPTAAFLNPYPRDFRKGVFKFKSTSKGKKPTDEDLSRVITYGINGTAMPSFEASLKKGEIKAIIDYVKYLAIRGEVERGLIQFQTQDADYSDEEVEASREEFLSTDLLVTEYLAAVLDTWREVETEEFQESMFVYQTEDGDVTWKSRPPKYDPTSDDFDELALGESIKRGNQLYYGAGGCVKCHGPSQLGDGQKTDYDDWTKEFHNWADEKNDVYYQRLKEFTDMGGLKPRTIWPRNLRMGVYRGGRRPIDIFYRIRNGIDGTPMPAADRTIVDDDGVWDIVNFVLSVPYQRLSRDGDVTSYARDRQ